MNRKSNGLKCLLCALLLLVICFPVNAAAPSGTPYDSYEYNSYNRPVVAPDGYVQTAFFGWEDIGLVEALDNARDMCFDGNYFYILDSGNGRIVKTDRQFKLVDEYGAFRMNEGETVDFTGAQGLTIDENGTMYIADTEGNRIIVAGSDGAIKLIVTRPDEALNDANLPFRVSKVRVNSTGEIYVIADNINLGIFVFDADGKFNKFEGSNPVYKTADVMMSYFMKRFRTREQLENMVKTTPLRVLNFHIDAEDYIYSVSFNDKVVDQTEMVRKLNYRGNNIIAKEKGFGDFETPADKWEITKFVGIDVDENGFIYLLDATRGRVFQYSKQGYLVTIFGGYGDYKGTFGDPTQLKMVDGKIYVLDAKKMGVHEFSPTEYVQTFNRAITSLDNRDIDTSFGLWNELLALNTNSVYPYYGLGMIYDARGDYLKAMESYRLAGAQEEYSAAMGEYRKLWIGRNYVWVTLVIILVIALAVLAVRTVKKRLAAEHGGTYSALENKWFFPLYTLFHPVDGFEQFLTRKDLPSYRLAGGIVAAWFGITSLSWFFTGYSFSNARANDFNPLAALVSTIGIYLLFVISNWCLCTLFNGKGTMKSIAASCAYALIPYICAVGLRVFLSNILTAGESSFLSILMTVGLLWSAFLLLGALYGIHQFTFGKTVLSVVATVAGMGVIMLLIVLFYTLLSQAFSFMQSIQLELSLR